MKTRFLSLILGFFLVIAVDYSSIAQFSRPSQKSQNEEKKDDKTLSPYFFVQSDSAETDCLPLLETTADVVISGVIADVTVRQVYKNSGKHTLEAVYVFPASTRAAVYAMTMTIGERVLEAVIKPKQKAREMYEQAKSEGRTASLLEQQRPNVFQMNVANIIPGDLIVVEMKYTELLVPEDKIYEFVYPTVVGPRYSNKKESEASEDDKFVNTPYLHQGSEMPFKFDITVKIAAGMNIDLIECPSHPAIIEKGEPNEAEIKLSDEGKKTWNKDYILRYTLAGENIETGMLISTGEENFFLLMLQPPKRLEPKNIPPREYIYIVDVSGSMHGFPIDVAKELMKNLLNSLEPEDKFNVLVFSMGQGLLAEESVQATSKNIDSAFKMLVRQSGGGGTELLPALKRALALPKAEGYSRSIVVITDGYVDCEREAFDLIRNNLNNSNLFSFGIGSSVNRYIIDGMAHAGGGEPFVVFAHDEAEYMSAKLNEYIKSPVMTGIEIDYGGFKAYDVEPVSIPDVLADRPILIYGKWEGAADGVIKVSGFYGDKKIHVDIPVSQFANYTNNPAIKYLWARNKIAILSDYANLGNVPKEEEEEVTNLGMKYNLLTQYTSFIAEDYIVRNEGGKQVKVKQALPLPEGVTDNAVGGEGIGMNGIQGVANISAGAISTGSGYNLRGSRSGGGLMVEDNPLIPVEKVSPWYFGPVFGYQRVVHGVSLPTVKGDDLSPKYGSSIKNGFYAGLSVEYLLGDPTNSRSSLIARLIFNSMPGEFEEYGNPVQALTTGENGQDVLIEAQTKHEMKITYNFLSLEAQYKLNLFESTFGFTVGPTFDFAITNNQLQKQKITDPLGARFVKPDDWAARGYRYEDNDGTLVFYDGDIQDASIFRLGLKMGYHYEILLGRWYIVPSLNYNVGITTQNKENDWRINTLQFGIDIRFSI